MRFLKIIIIFLIFFSFAGIGVYVIGPDLSAERFVLETTEKLKDSGQMEKVVEYVENDPQTINYIEAVQVSEQQEQAHTTNKNLPFETPEDAAQTLVEKVGIKNLIKMKSEVGDGTMSPEEVIKKLEEDLNEEELLALKLIILKEFSKQQ
ncbi:hypothetical protein B481_1974 [Planococcus halocryophilus Or1]|uniref:Phenylalanyl-tRNA synthetase subunit beta n=1 Tax=Planococcus halocryophilus TaxID=1215089 RepID=A0A1C7DPM8_9BACL|nr:hypothetical protein [Planococcus halocryophilus]ANU13446.1 hypothetical protein BBI08_06145 [Planococcus halocryophilus]EMF46247.1 hypothetical protein B481_1974 [Planococcus halocryophilus Or1]